MIARKMKLRTEKQIFFLFTKAKVPFLQNFRKGRPRALKTVKGNWLM